MVESEGEPIICYQCRTPVFFQHIKDQELPHCAKCAEKDAKIAKARKIFEYIAGPSKIRTSSGALKHCVRLAKEGLKQIP